MAPSRRTISVRLFLTLLVLYWKHTSCFSVPRRDMSQHVGQISQIGTRMKGSVVQTTIPSQNKNFRLDTKPTALRAKDDEIDDANEDSSRMWLFSLVLPLLFVYISNQWSRSSIYYLVNFSDGADPFRAMNLDIGFTEAQYGVLASLAFTTLFAVASLGAGIASGRYNRKLLTVVAAVGWGVATLGTSLSSTRLCSAIITS
jgi:hypothetical protein